MGKRRTRFLSVGHTYGIGSLLFAPRTIVELLDRGTTIVYRAEETPITAGVTTLNREGRIYTCSRSQFLKWLRQTQKVA